MSYTKNYKHRDYKELNYQTFYHDILVYIQGVEISSWLTGSLNITYGLNSNPNTANFTLTNDNHRWVLTEENVGKGITAQTVKDKKNNNNWRVGIDDNKRDLIKIKTWLDVVEERRRIEGICTTITKHVQQYATILQKKEQKKQADLNEENIRTNKIKSAKNRLNNLQKTYNSKYTHINTQSKQRLVNPYLSPQDNRNRKQLLDQIRIEKAKLRKLKANTGFYADSKEAALEQNKTDNKKAALEKAKKKGLITADELGFSSLTNILLTTYGTIGLKYIDPSKTSIDNKVLMALKQSREDSTSKNYLNYKQYYNKIKNMLGKIGKSNNDTLNKFIKAIKDGGLQEETAKGIIYSTYLRYVLTYNNPRAYGMMNPIDPNTGQPVYAFHVGKCVFNKNDPIRIFVHNPYNQEDEYKNVFTGYIDHWEIRNGFTNGESDIQISCYDIRALMDKMRVQMNPTVGNVTPEALFTNENSLFGDLVFENNKGSHPFARVSLEGALRILIVGGDITRLEREQTDVKQQKLDNRKQTIERIQKKRTAFINKMKKIFDKPEVANTYGDSVLNINALNKNRTSGIGNFKHGFTVELTTGATRGSTYNDEKGEPVREVSGMSYGSSFYMLRAWHELSLLGVNSSKNIDLLINNNTNKDNFNNETYTKHYLTKQEAHTMGSLTVTGCTFSPDSSYLHMLLPENGSGVRDIVEYNRIGYKQSYEWRTRLQLIAEMCDAVDFKFYVSPVGDFCLEMPMYDFHPSDFLDITKRKYGIQTLSDQFTVKDMIIDSSVADEKNEIVTSIIVQGGRTNAGQTQQSLNQGGKFNTLRTFGISPTMAGRYGVTTKTIQKNWLSDPEKLRELTKVEFIKSLFKANDYSINFTGHWELWLNRPLLSVSDLRMGSIDSFSLQYQINGSVTQSVGLTYIRTLSTDGLFRFISGGDMMPFSYRTEALTTTYDAKGIEDKAYIKTAKKKAAVLAKSGVRVFPASYTNYKKEEKKEEKKEATKVDSKVDSKDTPQPLLLSSWESTFAMSELKDMFETQWNKGKVKDVSMPRSRVKIKGRYYNFPRGTGVGKTGFGGENDPGVLRKEDFEGWDDKKYEFKAPLNFKKRFDVNNESKATHIGTASLKSFIFEQLEFRYNRLLQKPLTNKRKKLMAYYITWCNELYKYGSKSLTRFQYTSGWKSIQYGVLFGIKYPNPFPLGMIHYKYNSSYKWTMDINTLWRLAIRYLGKKLKTRGETARITGEVAAEISDNDWVCAIPIIYKDVFKEINSSKIQDVLDWWGNRLLIVNYGKLYWVMRVAELRGKGKVTANAIIEMQNKTLLNNIHTNKKITLQNDNSDFIKTKTYTGVTEYPNQHNNNTWKYWIKDSRTGAGKGEIFKKNKVYRIAFLDDEGSKANMTLGKRDPRLGMGYIRPDKPHDLVDVKTPKKFQTQYSRNVTVVKKKRV